MEYVVDLTKEVIYNKEETCGALTEGGCKCVVEMLECGKPFSIRIQNREYSIGRVCMNRIVFAMYSKDGSGRLTFSKHYCSGNEQVGFRKV